MTELSFSIRAIQDDVQIFPQNIKINLEQDISFE